MCVWHRPRPRETSRQEAAARTPGTLLRRIGERRRRRARASPRRGFPRHALGLPNRWRSARVAWRVPDDGHATRSAKSVPGCSAAKCQATRRSPAAMLRCCVLKSSRPWQEQNAARRTCAIGTHVKLNARNASSYILTGVSNRGKRRRDYVTAIRPGAAAPRRQAAEMACVRFPLDPAFIEVRRRISPSPRPHP